MDDHPIRTTLLKGIRISYRLSIQIFSNYPAALETKLYGFYKHQTCYSPLASSSVSEPKAARFPESLFGAFDGWAGVEEGGRFLLVGVCFIVIPPPKPK